MKKILGISLIAVMSVSAANANIASQKYVDDKIGTMGEFQTVMAAVNSKEDTIPANTYDAYGSASDAQSAAQSYTDTKIGTLGNKAENTPYADVKDYVDTKVAQVSGDVAALGDLASLNVVAESNLAEALATKINAKQNAATAVTHTENTAAGSATRPVYISDAGVATAINENVFDAYGTAAAVQTALEGIIGTVAENHTVMGDIAALSTSAGNTYQAKSQAAYSMGKADGTWEAMSEAQQNALNSTITSTKVSGYDTTKSAVDNETTGLAATRTVALAAVPKPGTACSDTTNKCVLTTDGTNFVWEVVSR